MPEKASVAEELILEADFEGLELSEHQRLMLLPVEARIQNQVYPASVQSRVANHFEALSKKLKDGGPRKNKWTAKLKGHFTGKLRSKWNHTLRKLGQEKGLKSIKSALPQIVEKEKVKKKTKPASSRHARSQKKNRRNQTELLEHASKGKGVRVTADLAGESYVGRVGQVVRVYEIEPLEGDEKGTKYLEYSVVEQVGEELTASIFFVKADHCKIHDGAADKETVPVFLDYRVFNGGRKNQVVKELGVEKEPHCLEAIVRGELIEHSSLRAALIELEVRFNTSGIMLLPPAVAIWLADPDGFAKDSGCETEKF